MQIRGDNNVIKEIKIVVCEISFMVIYHFCQWFRLTLRTQEVKQRQSNQLGVWVREVGGNLLPQIAKMADRFFAARVLLVL